MSHIDPNRICPSCLNEMPRKGFPCPLCGYTPDTVEQSPRCMPPYTILAGRYLVGTVLGEGGFGITYRGWDLEQDRKIAIKEYFPTGLVTRDTSHGGDNTVQSISGQMRVHYKAGLEKYENEARCLMRLKGTPGIVDILAFFHENATAYIVMEFIEGVTLRQYLASNNGCLPEKQTLEMFQPLLASLEKVHQAGIVHRDISPDNIIVQPDGRLKLIDFGAARQATGEATQSLTVILKHGYAPEEQYRSRSKQGPYTDVYAISATIYKTLTGVTPVDSMSRMFEDELKPLNQYPNRIAPRTCTAIQKGMEVRAENRYQTIKELTAALYKKEVTEEPTLAMPVSKRKHTGKMLTLIAAGVAACAFLILGAMSLTKPRTPPTANIPAEEAPQTLEIPDLEGTAEAEATAALEALGLYVTVEYAPADGAHTGVVLCQEQTSDQSVTLTVGELTSFTFIETEDGMELTGTSAENEFLELPDTINGIPVTSIGAYAFAEDVDETQALYQVSFPKQLVRIGEGAFSGCLFLGKVQLPDTVTDIGDGAFWNCSAISELTLPSGLQHVGDYAFQYCYGLPEIVLPEGCLTVGEQAFEGCMAAEKIVLPAGLTEIGPGAFTGCNAATIYAVAGTYGERYVKESDLPYLITEAGAGTPSLNYQTVNFSLAGMQLQLEAAGIPAGADVLFQSSNILVATVTDDGLVTAVSNGEAEINATWEGGELTCTVSCDLIADPAERYVDTLGYQIAKAKKPTVAANYLYLNDFQGDMIIACKNDGTCSLAGYDWASNPIENAQSMAPVFDLLDEWDSVISVAASDIGLYGLKEDGTVVGIYIEEEMIFEDGKPLLTGILKGVFADTHVSEWNNIVEITSCNSGIAGLRSNGTVVTALCTQNLTNQDRRKWEVRATENWGDIVAIAGSNYDDLAAIRADGHVVFIPSNDVSVWENIVDRSASNFYAAGLKKDGTVVVSNFSGWTDSQWIGPSNATDWRDIVSIAASDDLLVGLKSDGTVMLAVNASTECDLPLAESDLDTWTDIVAIEGSPNCVIGLRADGTVLCAKRTDVFTSGWVLACKTTVLDSLHDVRIPEI